MGLNAIIVGAGIGGFATAIALRQSGHKVTILEKYSNKREVGFAVSCPPNAARVLRSFGFDFKKARMNDWGGMDFANATKMPYEVTSHQPQDDVEERYGAPSMAVHRVDYHNALRELATGPEGEGVPVEVREGMTVVEYDAEGGSVTLEGGEIMKADVVVAADGVKSKAHKWIIGEERPATLSRLSNVRFCMPTETMLENPKLKRTLLNGDYPTIYFGTNRDVGIFRYPCRDNTLQNFGAYMMSKDVPSDETKWRSQTNLSVLEERLQGFDDNMLEVARAADPDDMYLWKVADRDPLPKYHKGRMIVMGDAAHPMQPTFGMGASFSIEDAGVLGAVLQGVDDAGEVKKRLALWEELRWQRASAMVLLCMMEKMTQYELSEETKNKLAKVLPRSEWPELTRPAVNEWCFGYDCLEEARMAVEGRFGKGDVGVVNGRL